MGNPEIPVGKSNGSCHSFWEAPENMGCDLRRAIFSVFRGRPFDFGGGYGWVQKKMCCILFLRGKKILQGNSWGWKISYTEKRWIILVAYSAVKKSYTVNFFFWGGGGDYISRGWGKKILTQAKPHPLKSQMVDPLVDLDMFCSGLYSHRVKCYSFMFMLKIFTRVVWPLVSSKTVYNTIGQQTPQANVSNRKLHVMFI